MAEVKDARGAAANPASAMGFGFGFMLAGVLLLLQDLGLPTARWPFVLPLILVLAGVLVLISGFTGIHRLRHPAVDKHIGDRGRTERLIVEPERWIPPSDQAGRQKSRASTRVG
jgi:hypothetical protein